MEQHELLSKIFDIGIFDVGFCTIDDSDTSLKSAISIAVPLSNAVIDEITDKPTHTYFNHYRTVNAYIDNILLQIGLLLQSNGYRYIQIPASQTVNKDGWNYVGRYSHKKAAVLSGLGSVGRSALFLHRKWGPRVRLGTIFCDFPFESCDNSDQLDLCLGCDRCKKACPSGAILGEDFDVSKTREQLVLPELCSTHMKKAFKDIGRGAVCGVCMAICPVKN